MGSEMCIRDSCTNWYYCFTPSLHRTNRVNQSKHFTKFANYLHRFCCDLVLICCTFAYFDAIISESYYCHNAGLNVSLSFSATCWTISISQQNFSAQAQLHRRAPRRNFTSLRAEYVLDFALSFALDFCHVGPLILPRGTLKQASDVRTFESNWFTQRCTDSKTKFTMSRLSAATTVCLL